MEPGITVVIPTIPPRRHLLQRALASVNAQTLAPNKVTMTPDRGRHGAARTRHRGLMQVRTEWVAFLDDDDEFLPSHLAAMHAAAVEHQADYLWSRFQIVGLGGQRFDGPAFLGEKAFSQWDDADPCQTTITTLVRTELAQDVGGFSQFDDNGEQIDGQRRGEDFEFTMRCRKAGGVFRHVPEVTWLWHHHGIGKPGVVGNTSGLPDRW